MKPADVNPENESVVWQTLYGDEPRKRRIKYKFNVYETYTEKTPSVQDSRLSWRRIGGDILRAGIAEHYKERL